MRPRQILPSPACALLAAIAILPGTSHGKPFSLRVLAQESIPPKWIPNQHGMRGVCPDILHAVEKVEPRLRFVRSLESRSIPVLEQGLENGSIDGACALLDTPRRRQIAEVAGAPLYSVRHRLAARASDPAAPSSFADLVALKPLINTPRSAGYADQLRALGLVVDDSTGDNVVNLRKIMAGHGRFFYINELTLTHMIGQPPFKGQVRMLPWVAKEEPIYFWVSKKTAPAAARLLDQALTKLAANGELARIYARWTDGAK